MKARLQIAGRWSGPLCFATLLCGVLLMACARITDSAVDESFRDCPHCPAMVVIPAGTFTMGSPLDEPDRGHDEGPTRQVSFGAAFAIGRTEVTRGEFAAFVAATGHALSNDCLIWDGSRLAEVAGKSWQDPGYPQTDEHPMVCVSWRDASAYARWLGEQTGYAYRLPSEAEWEYAARGGTQAAYAFPATAMACDYGNISDQRAAQAVPQWNNLDCDDGVGFGTAPVASYQANGYGLYDTVGNVWEWVADCYADNYTDAPRDGSARGDAGRCGVALDRGGGFSNIFPGHLRAANRSRAPSPDVAVYSLGFRVARPVEP